MQLRYCPFCSEKILESDPFHILKVMQKLVKSNVSSLIFSNLHTYTVVCYRAVNDVIVMYRHLRPVVAIKKDKISPFPCVAFENPYLQFV